MRPSSRRAVSLIALLCLGGFVPGPIGPTAARAQSQAPHAWLFGSWTGGLFPVPTNLPMQACLQQPVVMFTRDVVLRASITDQLYGQRLIETARTSGNTTEFRFAPATAQNSNNGLLGLQAQAPDVSFGCGDPNVLRVQRKSENEITFPGCADFPNPLVRCTPR